LKTISNQQMHGICRYRAKTMICVVRKQEEDRKDWHVPKKPDKNSVVNRERPPAGNGRRPHEERRIIPNRTHN